MLNGYFEGHLHYYEARIHYADTDAGGVVYHGRYLDFCERGRAGVLHLIDIPEIVESKNEVSFWVVRKAEIDYMAPARVGDIITVVTKFLHIGGASVKVEHLIKKEDDILVKIYLTLVLVSEKGRVQRLVPEIRHKMMAYIKNQ